MIKIVESDNNISKFDKYLQEQGYTREKLVDYAINKLVSNYWDGKYEGIKMAYDSDLSSKYSNSRVKEVIRGIIDESESYVVNELKSDPDIDITDILYDYLDEDEVVLDTLSDLDKEFEHLVDEQNKIWQSDIDYLNREYERSKL